MKDIKHIRRDFHLAWGHAPVLGLGGAVGGWGGGGGGVVVKNFFPKFNKIWCVSYLHECHMHLHHFLGPRPPGAFGRGQKVKYH